MAVHIKPVLPIVTHIIAAEGEHSHWVTPDDAHFSGCSRSGFRAHYGAHENTVLPVSGLVDQRSGFGTPSAEYNGGYGNSLRCFEFWGYAGAVFSRRCETGIGMSTLFTLRRIPGLTLPVERILGRIFMHVLPPDRIIVLVQKHICKNCVFTCGGKGIGI